MEFVTELEAKWHAVMQEVRDDIAALVKQFRSSAAVTDDQLQAVHDKLHAAIEGDAVQPAAIPSPDAVLAHVEDSQASGQQFPGEPALSPSPEGVLVEGAGIVSTEHLAAAGVPINTGVEGATSEQPGT